MTTITVTQKEEKISIKKQIYKTLRDTEVSDIAYNNYLAVLRNIISEDIIDTDKLYIDLYAYDNLTIVAALTQKIVNSMADDYVSFLELNNIVKLSSKSKADNDAKIFLIYSNMMDYFRYLSIYDDQIQNNIRDIRKCILNDDNSIELVKSMFVKPSYCFVTTIRDHPKSFEEIKNFRRPLIEKFLVSWAKAVHPHIDFVKDVYHYIQDMSTLLQLAMHSNINDILSSNYPTNINLLGWMDSSYTVNVDNLCKYILSNNYLREIYIDALFNAYVVDEIESDKMGRHKAVMETVIGVLCHNNNKEKETHSDRSFKLTKTEEGKLKAIWNAVANIQLNFHRFT